MFASGWCNATSPFAPSHLPPLRMFPQGNAASLEAMICKKREKSLQAKDFLSPFCYFSTQNPRGFLLIKSKDSLLPFSSSDGFKQHTKSGLTKKQLPCSHIPNKSDYGLTQCSHSCNMLTSK